MLYLKADRRGEVGSTLSSERKDAHKKVPARPPTEVGGKVI